MSEREIVEVQAPPNFANSLLNGCRAEVLRVANGITHVRLLDGAKQGIGWQLLSEHVRPIEPTPESDVVERLEAAIRRYPVNRDLLQCALTEFRRLGGKLDVWCETLHDVVDERDALREACEFYADPETWAPSADGIYVDSTLGRDRSTAPNGHDCPGAKARDALAQERI